MTSKEILTHLLTGGVLYYGDWFDRGLRPEGSSCFLHVGENGHCDFIKEILYNPEMFHKPKEKSVPIDHIQNGMLLDKVTDIHNEVIDRVNEMYSKFEED